MNALARCFVAVHDAYDLTHVLGAKRAIRKLGTEPRKKEFKGSHAERQAAEKADRLRRNWRTLSRPATALFKHCQSAERADEQFRTAVGIADCKNHPGLDEALTVTLAALHEAQQLPSPDKVGDGRLAYESMRRDYALLRDLGILSG